MHKIEIQVVETGAWLDVPDDMKIKMVFYSSVFPDNWNRRDRSEPIKLDKTPTNNNQLNWRGEIGVETDNAAIDVRVYEGHFFLFKATLRCTDVSETYNCHLLTTFGEWDYKTLDKKITDYAYDSGTPFTTPDADIIANTYPDVPFAFPVFYAFKFVDYRTGTAPGGQDVYKHTYYGMTPGSTNSTFVSPYVMYVVDKILEEEVGSKPTGSFKDEPELQKLVMLSNAHRPEDLTGWEFDAAKHLPDLRVSEFFDSLRAMFNVGLFFNKDGTAPKMLLNNAIIDSGFSVDWTRKTTRDLVKKFDLNVGKMKIGYSKEYYDLWSENDSPAVYKGPYPELSQYMVNVPGLNSTWLIQNENTYWSNSNNNGKEPLDYNCLQLDPSGFRRLPDVADVASLPAVTWASDAGKICLVKEDGWFYKVIFSYITSGAVWEKSMYDNWTYNSTEEDVVIEVESKIGIPVMDRIGGEISPGDERYYIPCFKNIRAITDLYENGGNTQHMSMMAFNRGNRLHGAGIGYEVLFSSDEYDYNHNVIGNYSLKTQGERGLINSFWKKTSEFIEDAIVYEAYPLLTLLDFQNFQFYNKIHIHGLTGLVRKLEIEFPLVKHCKIELVV